jgi:hypothetical protein
MIFPRSVIIQKGFKIIHIKASAALMVERTLLVCSSQDREEVPFFDGAVVQLNPLCSSTTSSAELTACLCDLARYFKTDSNAVLNTRKHLVFAYPKQIIWPFFCVVAFLGFWNQFNYLASVDIYLIFSGTARISRRKRAMFKIRYTVMQTLKDSISLIYYHIIISPFRG